MRKIKNCLVLVMAYVVTLSCLYGNNKVYVKAKTAVSISTDSQIIPTKSSRDNVNIINNGKVLYKIRVKAVVKNSRGNAIKNTAISFTDPNVSNVVRTSVDSKTDSNGVAYITYEVRGKQESKDFSFDVKATVNTALYSGTAKKSITCLEKSSYNHKFKITCYFIPLESDYSGSTTTVSGISGYRFKEKFIEAVKVQGTGYSSNGFYVHYDGNNTYSKHSSIPKTSSNTTPTEERTIAANNYIIPRYNNNGSYIRGCIRIGNHTQRYRNEDSGGDFDDNISSEWYNIDVFAGKGKTKLNKVVNQYTDDNGNTQSLNVVYLGNNKDLW